MKQYERMIKGLLYDPSDEEIMADQVTFQEELWKFNQLKPSETAAKQKYMKAMNILIL